MNKMGRQKKIKKFKTLSSDRNHWTAKRKEEKREAKVLKPGMFNVYAQDWLC